MRSAGYQTRIALYNSCLICDALVQSQSVVDSALRTIYIVQYIWSCNILSGASIATDNTHHARHTM
jgi:hypothetical protein